jgi:hypothetical protein
MKDQLISLMKQADLEGMAQFSNDLKRLVYRYYPGTDLVTETNNLKSITTGKKAWKDLNVDPKNMNASQQAPAAVAKKSDDNGSVETFDLEDFVGLTAQEVLDFMGNIKELRKKVKKAALNIDHALGDEEFVEKFILLANAGA